MDQVTTDDEIWTMHSDCYTETERGHSDVATLDFAAANQMAVVSRVKEALAKSRGDFMAFVYELWQEGVLEEEVYLRWIERTNVSPRT